MKCGFVARSGIVLSLVVATGCSSSSSPGAGDDAPDAATFPDGSSGDGGSTTHDAGADAHGDASTADGATADSSSGDASTSHEAGGATSG